MFYSATIFYYYTYIYFLFIFLRSDKCTSISRSLCWYAIFFFPQDERRRLRTVYVYNIIYLLEQTRNV
jgi:hypothetical protein